MRKLILFLMLLESAAPGAAAAASLGELLDHPFDRLDAETPAALRSFLSPDERLVLILWNSDCPKCLENVRQTGSLDLGALGARLVGVNDDPGRRDAQRFIAEHNLAFPQLHDPLGLVADAFACRGLSFSFVVLDAQGQLVFDFFDSVPDARVAIESALSSLAETGAPAMRPAAAHATSLMAGEAGVRFPFFQYGGKLRLRWLGVGIDDDLEASGCACPLGGPYGEALEPYRDLLYRFNYDIVARLSAALSAGARLRVGNEPRELLDQGPLFLTGEFGSAYVELRRGESSARAGFFEAAFTPLTLMWWDFADNPPASGSGGAGACGVCGGSARALRLDALDDLGPTMTFEGAKLSASPRAGVELTALFARPVEAREFSPADPGQFRYRQDLFGARLAWRPPLPAVLSLNYVATREDPSSSDWSESPYDPLSFIHQGEVASLTLAIDGPLGFALAGEAAKSFRRADPIGARGDGATGKAYTLELRQETPGGPKLRAAYLELGENFGAEYGALSYLPDSKGWRLAGDYARGAWGASLFGKRLSRISGNLLSAMPRELEVAGGLLSWQARPSTALDLSGSRTREEREAGGPCTCYNWVWTAGAQQEIARRAELIVQYSKIWAEGDPEIGRARGDMGSLQFSLDF